MPTIYNYNKDEDKKVKQPNNSDNGLGLVYPFHEAEGAFEYTIKTIDAARANILHLLDTDKGSRLMKPEVGIGLREMLFEPITDTLESKFRKRIKRNIKEYVPYVRIDNLEINVNNENRDRNEVTIDIEFSLKNQPNINDRIRYTV